MALYALIRDGVVVNCIVADADVIAATFASQYDACVEYQPGTYVGAGFTYDGTNFIAPPPVPDTSSDDSND